MTISSVGGSPPISGLASAHTLQAFIELVYVQTANNVLVSQMASLESSLGLTKSVLDSLTQLQNLKNSIVVKSKGAFNAGYYSAGASVQQYSQGASAFFGKPVEVSVLFTGFQNNNSPIEFWFQMQNTYNKIRSGIASLSAVTGNLTDPNTLYAKLKTVTKNIESSFGSPFLLITDSSASVQNKVVKWVTDNYNLAATGGVASAGLIQQNITNAITAAQSLNTTQTESVRNFLYLYEEYYKSASAVLQAITQIIQKMADNIARGS